MKVKDSPVLGCLILVVFCVAFVAIGTRTELWFKSRAEKKELNIFAKRIGDFNIEAQVLSWKEIQSLLPEKPVIKPAEYVRNCMEFYFGPRRGLIGGDFYASEAKKIQSDSRPISMWVKSPFKGRLCGVRLGISREAAIAIIKKTYPYAHFTTNVFISKTADWAIEFGGNWSLTQYRDKDYGSYTIVLVNEGYQTTPIFDHFPN